MQNDIETVLHHETTILSRLDAMAREIMKDYRDKPLTVVAILHGGIIFMADLLRRVQLPLRIETISVSSYHGGVESSGVITFNQIKLPDLSGEHVILIDDILDSGRTLAAIGERLERDCQALSIRSCVLLRKNKPRDLQVQADYVGFDIEDEFVVGYGLDYRGRYRNLPYIGTLKPEAIAAGAAK